MSEHDYESTRRSWNLATRNHNAHKGDQAAFLRGGGDTIFAEELELLGPLDGRRLVHLQCNSGQDTLCLARRGARAVGVDLSDHAIGVARELSAGSGIPAQFVEAELVAWMSTTEERFELAFSSYGAVSWMPDLDAWARGVARVLAPGGRFVYLEFHPLVWSVGKELSVTDGDDYFARKPFVVPVGDYVLESGAGLGAVTRGETEENTIPAYAWQYGVAQIVDALASAGLILERLVEYPHSNGCKVHGRLVVDPTDPRRWVWPDGVAGRLPLMFGLSVRR